MVGNEEAPLDPIQCASHYRRACNLGVCLCVVPPVVTSAKIENQSVAVDRVVEDEEAVWLALLHHLGFRLDWLHARAAPNR